jgi:hypothetical protein
MEAERDLYSRFARVLRTAMPATMDRGVSIKTQTAPGLIWSTVLALAEMPKGASRALA